MVGGLTVIACPGALAQHLHPDKGKTAFCIIPTNLAVLDHANCLEQGFQVLPDGRAQDDDKNFFEMVVAMLFKCSGDVEFPFLSRRQLRSLVKQHGGV